MVGLKRASLIAAMIVLLLVSLASVQAQEVPTVLIAGVEDDTVYIARISSSRGTRRADVFTGGSQYANMEWDPQLLWVIFTYVDEQGKRILAASDNTGEPAVPVAEGIADAPVHFTARGDEIIYAKETGDGLLDVYSQGVRGFVGFVDEPTRIATIPYEMDCDTSGLIAPQIALMQEIEGVPELNMNRPILFKSPHGLVHSEGCAGTKTFLTDLESGETVELVDHLQWAVPSGDGERLAGIRYGKLVIVELEDQTYRTLPTSAPPSYPIVWGDWDHPNQLLYTTRQQVGRRSLDPDDERKVVELAGEAALQLWNTAIYEMNLATFDDREVYRQIAYGIGEMAVVINEGLVFSEIRPLTTWVDGLVNGTISDPFDESAIDVNLYHLDLNTRRRTLVAENLQQAVINWSAAAG
jgi:hypothetical protein